MRQSKFIERLEMFRKQKPSLWAGMVFILCVAAQGQPPLSTEYNNRGVEAFKARDFGSAIALLEQAFELDPENTTVSHNLCNAYQGQANEFYLMKDYRAAMAYLERAVKLDPRNVSPWVQLGSCYLNLGDVNEAIVQLERAIEIKPGELNAHEMLGQAYYMDNDLSSARAQWEYVLEMDPQRTNLRKRYEKAFREESVEYDFNKWKSRHFRISYPKDIPATLRTSVSSTLDRAYIDIGRAFGGVFPPPPIYVVLYSAEQFSEATQLEKHIGAVYDGKIRTPLTDSNGEWLAQEELQRRLVHEYVHVVARSIASDNMPWWVNEGLAETLSKSFSEYDIARLSDVYAAGGGYSLAHLESNRVEAFSPKDLKLAYLQSHATVDLLWSRLGQSRMMRFLRALSNGMNGEAALQAAYQRTYADLERQVAAAYR